MNFFLLKIKIIPILFLFFGCGEYYRNGASPSLKDIYQALENETGRQFITFVTLAEEVHQDYAIRDNMAHCYLDSSLILMRYGYKNSEYWIKEGLMIHELIHCECGEVGHEETGVMRSDFPIGFTKEKYLEFRDRAIQHLKDC